MTASVADRVMTTLLLHTEAATMVLGDRLGLWSALAGRPLSAEEAAEACGVAPRYAREWCEAMAVSGWLELAGGRYRVAEAAVPVLADPTSPAYLMPQLRQTTAAISSLRALEAAYRTGTGLAWADHDPDVRESQGAGNAMTLRDDLPGWVETHLPELAGRLREAGGRIADVGCGYGWASVGLATRFPLATVDAFDPDSPSADAAARHCTGLAVTVHDRALKAGDGPFDLVVMAEMLHDVPDPVAVLHSAAECLAPDGVVLVVDMAAADRLETPGDDVQRLLYGWSLLMCLPDSMATPGSAATGAVMRRDTFARHVAAAGLRVREELPVVHDVWRFSVLTPA